MCMVQKRSRLSMGWCRTCLVFCPEGRAPFWMRQKRLRLQCFKSPNSDTTRWQHMGSQTFPDTHDEPYCLLTAASTRLHSVSLHFTIGMKRQPAGPRLAPMRRGKEKCDGQREREREGGSCREEGRAGGRKRERVGSESKSPTIMPALKAPVGVSQSRTTLVWPSCPKGTWQTICMSRR
jgi:hypothetical protein